jgi:hypothetical protein
MAMISSARVQAKLVNGVRLFVEKVVQRMADGADEESAISAERKRDSFRFELYEKWLASCGWAGFGDVLQWLATDPTAVRRILRASEPPYPIEGKVMTGLMLAGLQSTPRSARESKREGELKTASEIDAECARVLAAHERIFPKTKTASAVAADAIEPGAVAPATPAFNEIESRLYDKRARHLATEGKPMSKSEALAELMREDPQLFGRVRTQMRAQREAAAKAARSAKPAKRELSAAEIKLSEKVTTLMELLPGLEQHKAVSMVLQKDAILFQEITEARRAARKEG